MQSRIDELLKKDYNILTEEFGERQVIGVFVYGLANCGLAEDCDDIQIVGCICPPFEEFCCHDSKLKSYYIEDNLGKKIRITDIRLLYEKALHQESIILEAVFTDYKIINPRYKKAFHRYVYINREVIFHGNQKLRIQQAIKIGKNSIEKYKNAEIKDVNDLLKASYIRITCRQYLDGISCENCVNMKQDYFKNYLMQIKHKQLIPDIEEIEDDFDSILEEAEELPEENHTTQNLIKIAIMEIAKVSLTDIAQDIDNFETLLTKTELQAFKMILDQLENGIEGDISISQLTNSSTISRPVFKNTIQKMKDNKIAEIENRGVKGTHIKIIDGNVLQMR